MLRASQNPLTDAASGRMSMPFLPSLAVAIVLAAASLLCPPSRPTAPTRTPEGRAAPAPGPTAFGPPAISASPGRAPAALAFAAIYPLDSASAPGPLAEVSATPVAHPPVAPRATTHLAAAGRRPCAGRRCVDPAPATPQRGLDPIAAVSAEAQAAEDALIPSLALPFAAVAETLAPAARVVGRAADLMRGGVASVNGSVAILAECLP